MSLLQDEQLDAIEKQGKSRQIYKIEFFLTVLVCIVLSAFVLSLYVPEGVSSVPITLEATLFAIVVALLAAPWAGRLIALIFAVATAVFVAYKIMNFGGVESTTYSNSLDVWIIGVSAFALILLIWKATSYFSPQNKEARAYEKMMKKSGRW